GAAAPHQYRAGLRGRSGRRGGLLRMQFIPGQGLDQVIDELVHFGAPERKAGGAQGPGPTAAAAAPRPREPAPGRIVESLRSGRFAAGGAAPPSDVLPAAATGPAATERFAPAATSARARTDAGPDRRVPGLDRGPAGSAVLPGGSQV